MRLHFVLGLFGLLPLGLGGCHQHHGPDAGPGITFDAGEAWLTCGEAHRFGRANDPCLFEGRCTQTAACSGGGTIREVACVDGRLQVRGRVCSPYRVARCEWYFEDDLEPHVPCGFWADDGCRVPAAEPGCARVAHCVYGFVHESRECE